MMEYEKVPGTDLRTMARHTWWCGSDRMMCPKVSDSRRLSIVLVVAVLVGAVSAAGAQDGPLLPVPIPTPTPAPPEDSPEEPEEAGETRETAEFQEEPPDTEEPKSDDSADIDWKEEEGIAHTEFRPFDANSIEAELLDLKWSNFVAALRGLGRYSLFHDKVKFRLGLKVQADGTTGFQDDKFLEYYPPIDNTFDLRRLQLFAVGIVRNMNFVVGFDIGSDWGLKDAWVEGRKGGLTVWGRNLGKLRLGQMKEPFSLERQISSFFTGYLERSLPVQTFSPGHNVGVMVHDAGKRRRMTWAVGVFSFGKSNEDNASTSTLSLTTRWTFLPMYQKEGRQVMHLGGSFSTRSPFGDTRYGSRPEARFVEVLVDTGSMNVSRTRLVGLEFAMVQGPIWAQAEYIRADLDAQLIGDPSFMGSYGQVGFFLTGDVRPYKRNSGVFDRVQPKKNYRGGNPFKKKNGGAWEVVGRYSRVDLTDKEVNGGILNDISGALNWYINPTTRVQFNYIYASPKNQGRANIFVLRLQYIPW